MVHLNGDLAGLLDHFGYDKAVFVGHDWGAIGLWGFCLLHPDRISGLVNMSVPFMDRGESEWVGFWEKMLGPDMYIVHFNRQPGVADRAFEKNTQRMLRGMFRTDQWLDEPNPARAPVPGMPIINMAEGKIEPGGRLLMSEEELQVFVEGFKQSGFTAPINWYRNFTRNWHTLGNYEQKVKVPTLMIYGEYDMVPKSDNLGAFVDDLEVHTLDCGHWIQQERPVETNSIMMEWLSRHDTR